MDKHHIETKSANKNEKQKVALKSPNNHKANQPKQNPKPKTIQIPITKRLNILSYPN